MTPRIVVIAPSIGHGGGIERYVETVVAALSENSECRRIDLLSPGQRSSPLQHARLVHRIRSELRTHTGPVRLVVAHRNLLPAALLALRSRSGGVSLICHGNEIWSPSRGWTRWLMRRSDVRLVAVSSFSAGALLTISQATVLRPGLSRTWRDTLVRAGSHPRAPGSGVHIVTAFRLGQWESKGLPTLLAAVAATGSPDVTVHVCGRGPVPSDLQEVVDRTPGCVLHTDLTDDALADRLARSDLFVLATKVAPGARASGEGYGLVLLEAQTAGTPVVAPAFGGSHDAFVDGVTGVAPTDESVEALTRVLDELLRDTARRVRMGVAAGAWAASQTDPSGYARAARERLL